MRRVLIAAFAALILGIGLVWTQPTEAWLAQAPASAPSFTGVGDTYALQTHWGIVAYKASVAGNKIINACNSTGGIDVSCADMSTSATTGLLVPATIGAITCPGANCTVKIFYDDTGNTTCNSTACDATQTTVANRASLTANCSGSVPCAQFSSTNCYTSQTGGSPASGASYTVIAASQRTGSFTSYQEMLSGGESSLPGAGYGNSANSAFFFDGSNINKVTASDAAAHNLAFAAASGASNTIIYVDGSSAGTGTMGNYSQFWAIGAQSASAGTCGSFPFTGNLFELGFGNTTISSGNAATVNTTQTTNLGT